MKFKTLVIILLVLVVAFADGCRSHHAKKKKLKPGKPIPCPLKDC